MPSSFFVKIKSERARTIKIKPTIRKDKNTGATLNDRSEIRDHRRWAGSIVEIKTSFFGRGKRQQSVRRFLATPIASVQTDPGTALYVEVRDFWMDGKHSTIIFVSLKNKSLSIYICVSIYKWLLLCFFLSESIAVVVPSWWLCGLLSFLW